MRKNWKEIGKRVAVCAAFAVIILIGAQQYKEEQLVQGLSSKILRFHVLANSDSQIDQSLKLKVRDAIGAYMQQELDGVMGMEESKVVVTDSLEEIENTAKQVMEQEGFSYDVHASLAKVDFPQKTYGNYTFPAGEYEALQVVIGEGKGQNWWCVMYPNMCFFNSIYEVVDEDAEESLQRVLTTEEYKAVMEEKDYEIKFRWKFIENIFSAL